MSSKGQISIPVSVREALGLKQHTKLRFSVDEKKRIIIEKQPDIVDLAGTMGPVDVDVLTAREFFSKNYERS
jgi:AbrB family looped-hinge helix DNA binding protein